MRVSGEQWMFGAGGHSRALSGGMRDYGRTIAG
jgi:hypothetical protein